VLRVGITSKHPLLRANANWRPITPLAFGRRAVELQELSVIHVAAERVAYGFDVSAPSIASELDAVCEPVL
jgi:hypothetical protein